jgi:cytochrome c oxidase subunit III
MAGHATKQISKEELWGGKISPFSSSYGKLMMWFFLVSDALTFGGLLCAYGFFRFSTDAALTWPTGEEIFNALPFLGGGYPLVYVALMTFLLIISSVTMVLAVEAGHRMDKKGVIKYMVLTIIGGFFFLGSQAWEWSHFIHGGGWGRVQMEDGSSWRADFPHLHVDAITITKESEEHAMGKSITGEHASHMFAEILEDHPSELVIGENNMPTAIHFADGSEASITIGHVVDEDFKLVQQNNGKNLELDHANKIVAGEKARGMYFGALAKNPEGRVMGANLSENEYGPNQYSQLFFFITGFHGFHVFSGVVINIIILIMAVTGVLHRRGHYEMVEKTGLYWHFVDLVWVFVFTFFYLV